jgi:hypothetical protein
LEKILRRMLARRPEDRFPSTHECRKTLLDLDRLRKLEPRDPADPAASPPLVIADDIANAAAPGDTVFAPANTLNAFLARLNIEPRSPWDADHPSPSPTVRDPVVETRPDPDGAGTDVSRHRPSALHEGEVTPLAAGEAHAAEPRGEPGSRAMNLSTDNGFQSRRAERTPLRSAGREGWWRALLAGGVAAVIGWGVGSAVRAIGLLDFGRSVEPLYGYRGALKPSPKDAALARRMLAEAESEIRQANLEAAERLLGTCVELSDLPDCHRALASMLSVTGSLHARAHLERYVATATAADDLEIVRNILRRGSSPRSSDNDAAARTKASRK